MGHARARKVSAQLVEDEDYQLRYERVAGIDVAKAKADMCTRLPPAHEGGRRVSRVETVAATAREVLALAGRPKTDQKDAQWIARLAEMGCCGPRSCRRRRSGRCGTRPGTGLQLLKDRTRQWQRLEKLVEGALIKLSSVVYSMARNKTAWAILEAIVAGERHPKALAARAHGNIKGGSAVIVQALEGMLLADH